MLLASLVAKHFPTLVLEINRSFGNEQKLLNRYRETHHFYRFSIGRKEDYAKDGGEEFLIEIYCVRITNLCRFYMNLVTERSVSRQKNSLPQSLEQSSIMPDDPKNSDPTQFVIEK